MHIGILGGTFDPIHLGHCQLAWEATLAYKMDEVHFVPNHIPPHRAQPGASVQARCDMVALAIASAPTFHLSKQEVSRQGPSYMQETLAAFRAQYPTDTITLIVGMDAFAQFGKWHHYEQILNDANIAICERPGAPQMGDLERALVATAKLPQGQSLSGQPHGFIDIFTPFALLDIASTRLRALCAAKKAPYFILPPKVSDYINSKALYIS